MVARNIRDNDALTDLAKNSRLRIRIGLHYFLDKIENILVFNVLSRLYFNGKII